MTASELIVKLQKVDPTSEVWCLSDDNEYHGEADPPGGAVYLIRLEDGWLDRVERNVPAEEPGTSQTEVL